MHSTKTNLKPDRSPPRFRTEYMVHSCITQVTDHRRNMLIDQDDFSGLLAKEEECCNGATD